MSTAEAALPGRERILCDGKPIRFRWVQQIIWSFIAANIGVWIISAIYYLLVQVKWPGLTYGGHPHTVLYLKPLWNNLFGYSGWVNDRHDIRNIYETLLATLFVKSLMARRWRKHQDLAPAWYVAISPLLIVAVAAPFVVAGIAFFNHVIPSWFKGNPVHLPQSFAWLGTYFSQYPWQAIVIGVLVGLLVHRVYAPAGNTIQHYFVSRTVDAARDARAAGDADYKRHLPRFPLPPVVRERAYWLFDNDLPVLDRDRNITAAVAVATAVLTALAIYGAYVREVIAKGHGG